MRFPSKLSIFAFVAASVSFPVSALFAQGALAPPGIPAPTMKSLDQVEARIIVNSTNCPGDSTALFIISQPGSYYLTGNISGVSGKDGIAVTAPDVTLDLNGFSLIGVSGALFGVDALSQQPNLTIRNGSLRNWSTGIAAARGAIERIQASNNGTGIAVSKRSTVTNCSASSNTGTGMSASDSIVEHCIAANNSVGVAVFQSILSNCLVELNTTNGINAQGGAYVLENNCLSNSAAGIISSGGDNRIERNHIVGNATGLQASSGGSVFRENTVQDNTSANYNFAAGNRVELLLSQLPQTIAVPAKVTLTGTLTGVANASGIDVASDNVTIDLNGHALVGVANSLDGITVNGTRTNIAIRNGTVRNWAGNGISANSAGDGASYSDLEVNNNTGSGLFVGSRQRLTRINSHNNGIHGIVSGDACIIANCIVSQNGNDGIQAGNRCSIMDCTADANGSGAVGSGIVADLRAVVKNCSVAENRLHGIFVGNDAMILSNHSNHNGLGAAGDGIQFGATSLVQGNDASSNTGDGIHAATGSNLSRIDSNLADTNTGWGIHAGADYIIRNTANGNTGAVMAGTTANYNPSTGANVGPNGNASTATSPFANLQ